MKKQSLIFLTFCVFIASAEANIINDITNFFKGLMSKVTDSSPKEIQMPVIPKIVRNAKDVSSYDKKSNSKSEFFESLSEEQRKDISIGFVNELYKEVLGREPSLSEFQGKVGVLLQGGSREGVYRSLVLSDKFLTFEQTNNEPSSAVVEFTVKFLAKFLDAGLEEEKVEKLNFYTIKRFVIERCLETLDVFPNEHSILSWFAIMSSDLEKENRVQWKQKHRTLSKREAYYQWGSKIPLDILKSEVIIKLHKVFNELQLR